jgi:hypothetical protein
VNVATNVTWDITLSQQDYDAVTGGKVGPSIPLFSGPVTAIAGEAGVDVAAVDNDGMTHAFTYTAVPESGPAQVCSQTGYWTNPAGASLGPVAQNPGAKPNAAPLPTGTVEADRGTTQVLVEFNEPLDPASVPVASRFSVTGKNGAGANFNRPVTGVQISDNILILSFTAALPNAGTVQVGYTKPLTGNVLRDPDLLPVANFTTNPPVPIT